jgi:adenosylcobyric acid synthase
MSPGPGQYDFIVLPGSKNTIADLNWLRTLGLADWITAQHRGGATIIGICGGYQMMGESVADPLGVETTTTEAEGLGLIPATTVLTPEKRTRTVTATLTDGTTFGAYEIHMGVTRLNPPAIARPFARLDDGSNDGVWLEGAIGTYLHGALENPDVCTAVFGVAPPLAESKADHYEHLATWFEQYQRHFGELGLV